MAHTWHSVKCIRNNLKEPEMKKIFFLSLLTVFILSGCMSDNIVDPVSSQNSQFPGFQWIETPNNSLKTETELTVNKVINGNLGGRITIDLPLGNVEVYGSLVVPSGAYPGKETISITFNDQKFYQEYYPSPYTFRTPLILNLTYHNVDFSTDSPINFYYMDDDGFIYRAQYDALIVDPVNKTLGIVNARLPHFSRWGWAKTAQ